MIRLLYLVAALVFATGVQAQKIVVEGTKYQGMAPEATPKAL